VSATGCGTLYNHEIGPCPRCRPDTFRVYGGVRKDVEMVTAGFRAEPGDGPRVALFPLAAAFLAVDLPLSAAGDTLTLPITIPAALQRRRQQEATGGEPPEQPLNESPLAHTHGQDFFPSDSGTWRNVRE
jgi:hypothetical protein